MIIRKVPTHEDLTEFWKTTALQMGIDMIDMALYIAFTSHRDAFHYIRELVINAS